MSRKQLGLFFSAFSMILLVMSVVYGRQALAQGQGNGREAAFANPQAPTAIIGATPTELAAAMNIPGSAIVSASYNGSDPLAFGIGDAPLGVYFPSNGNTFAILSTGLATSADLPNDSGSLSYSLDGLNNSAGHDLAQLALKLNIPNSVNCVGFDFAFYSEEFPEFVNSQFNDTFTAELGGTNLTISGTQVIAPLNFAYGALGEIISVNTAFGVGSVTASTYDGITPFLRATTPVTPGSIADIVFSIQDLGDSIYDSAVFIDNFFFSNDLCQSGTGYTPGNFLINPTTGGIIEYLNIDGTSTSLNFPANATDDQALITFTPLYSPTQPLGFLNNMEGTGAPIYAGHAFNIDGALLVEHVYLPFISRTGSPGTASTTAQPSITASQPPTDTTFYLNYPVTLTLTYTDTDWSDVGIDENTLRMWYYDENSGVWGPAVNTCLGIIDPLPTPVLDIINNTYTVLVCHFTEFGFVGN
jgi:hypothetical protein